MGLIIIVFGQCCLEERYPKKYKRMTLFHFPKPKRRLEDCNASIRVCDGPQHMICLCKAKGAELTQCTPDHESAYCQLYVEGSRPEWCISSMIYSGDTPFWSETLDVHCCQGKNRCQSGQGSQLPLKFSCTDNRLLSSTQQ